MAQVPGDLRYTREHEWAKVEGQNVRVGITAFAQEQLGDVVFVELPKVGTRIGQMQPFGVVESVKAVSDLFAPLAGEVIEVNTALTRAPELVNQDPYGQGWMIVITPEQVNQLEGLMSATDYEAFVAGAAH
jgi:glycine cleavage system H protein